MKEIEEIVTKEGLTITLYDDGAIGLSNKFSEIGLNSEDMADFDKIYAKSRKILKETNSEL